MKNKLSKGLSLSVNPKHSISERFKASTRGFCHFLEKFESGRNPLFSVILGHTLNVILGFIPRIHAKHSSSLDTRDRLSVTPEYDNRKNFIKGLDVVRQCAALLERLNIHTNISSLFCHPRAWLSARPEDLDSRNKSENDNLVAQCGRSMIEMLGVLAIIGVLSVGGIAGYSKAMMKFKINKTAEQISQIVTNIRTLYLQQKDYNGLGDSSAIQMGAIPDDLTIDSSGNIKNIFGGNIRIRTSTSSYAWHNSVGDTDDAFMISVYNLPKEACVALATMDWGTFSTGLIAVSVNDDGFSNSTYNFPKCNGYSEQRYVAGCPGDSTVSVPIPVSLAATACNYWSSPNFNLMFY